MATRGLKQQAIMCAVLLMFVAVAGGAARATDSAGQTTLRVCSEWEPDEAVAAAAAEMKLRGALRQWLTATRPSTEPIATPENLTRLLALPGIRRTETIERKERSFGNFARVHSSVQLPPATIGDWRAQILNESQQSRHRLLLKFTGIITSLAVLLATVRVLDVWTRGYRRRSLGILLAVLAAMIFAAALTMLY